MKKTNIRKAIKRVNKSKEQISAEMAHINKVAQIKDMVKRFFPKLENVESIYDAQTVVNALAGFIDANVEKQVAKIKLQDIEIDLSKEEDSEIKKAILAIMEEFKDESAQELSETLERFGSTLTKFAADKFLREPMTTLKLEDILA
jgi:uncharacterized protein YaaQ